MAAVTPPASLLARLPAPAQERLRAIGGAHRTPLGNRRDYQWTFDRHVAFFDGLGDDITSQALLGAVLAEVGIVRADGSPLPIGTISAALSRARERADAARLDAATLPAAGGRLRGAGEPGNDPSPPAEGNKARPRHADRRASQPARAANVQRPPAGHARTNDRGADRTQAGATTATPDRPDHRTTARNRRAAEILNQLRSRT